MVGRYNHNNFKLTAMGTRFILAATLLSFSLVLNGNTTDTTQLKLIGKWLLVKHLITHGGKTTNEITGNENYTYNFAVNGTYSLTCINKKNESNTTYKENGNSPIQAKHCSFIQ